jgi:hypothetical protein
MIYTSSQNWYSWSYNGVKFARSESAADAFSTEFNRRAVNTGSLKDELLIAARDILEHYPSLTPCIFFSGGVDSEIVLRSFIEIGAKPKVYIVRYEQDYNIYDVSYAVAICSTLGVEHTIIDFNLKKFYENDAEQISADAQLDRAMTMPQLKFMDYVDGLPIYSASDPSWMRPSSDYSVKENWLMRCWEHDIGWSKYARFKNRPAVMEFFKWSPNLLAAWNQTKWLQHLINDRYTGRLGTNSTKIIGYREAFPDLIERKKKTGFETCDHLIIEFEQFLEKKYRGLPFRRYFDRTFDQVMLDLSQDLSVDPSCFCK